MNLGENMVHGSLGRYQKFAKQVLLELELMMKNFSGIASNHPTW